MSEKKREQAEKLYEAMSGIDPELLARSEKENQSEKKIIPFYRYARACAACIALFVVGVACWATLKNGGMKQEAATTNKAANGAQEAASNSQHMKAATDGVQAEAAADSSYKNEAFEKIEEDEFSSNVAYEASEMADGENGNAKTSEMEEAAGASATQNIQADTSATLNAYKSIRGMKDYSLDVFQGENLRIVFGPNQSEWILGKQLTLQTCAYFKLIRKEAVENASLGEDYVSVIVYAKPEAGEEIDEAEKLEVYELDRNYLIYAVAGEQYRIIDEEYDYEALVEELHQMTQGEE